MKKIIVSLIVLYAIATGFAIENQSTTVPSIASAEQSASLTGRWVADAKGLMKEEMKEMKSCLLYFEFGATKLNLDADIEGAIKENGMSMELGVRYSITTTYTRSGDQLTLKGKNLVPTVDIYKLQFDKKTEAALKQIGMTTEDMKEGMIQSIDKSNPFSDMETLEITELTADKLILTDDKGKSLVFKRVK